MNNEINRLASTKVITEYRFDFLDSDFPEGLSYGEKWQFMKNQAKMELDRKGLPYTGVESVSVQNKGEVDKCYCIMYNRNLT